MQSRILVIEDDMKIRKVVTTYLSMAGYDVTAVGDGAEGLQLAQAQRFDLLVLDVNLPSMDGMTIAAQLSAESDIYIIMLTARGEELDRIMGLSLGADDYMTKPFSPRELVARVQARLRRRSQEQSTSDLLKFSRLTIDPKRYAVQSQNGDPIELTPTEFKLLLELARHANFALSREQLLTRVWEDDPQRIGRVVDVFVNQLRRKLEQATGHPHIETVRSIGYCFSDPI
ncbi:MAG: response regulator transcription factor [Candidatus Promineifilaceae bacterium]